MPFVLGEKNDWLRQIAESELRDPVHFWRKINALPTVKGPVPISAIDAIEHLMPARDLLYRLARRVAGLGSLGHARYVAIADWNGGRIAREAKALVSSACYWAKDHQGPPEILYQTIISHAVRSLDPFVQLRGRWIVRRLSPHCSRIELVHASGTGQRITLASRDGIGNRQHSPWDEDGPQAHLRHHAKAEGEVVARSHGRDAEGSPRRLEDVEKRWVRVRERCSALTPRPPCAHWQPLPDSPQAAAVGPRDSAFPVIN